MSDQPSVLQMYELPHRGDPDDLRTELERRVPDVELTLASSYQDALERIGEADVVVTRKLTLELLDAADRLRWVQAINAGVDSYPLERLRSMGVTLTNASGVHAEPIAQQVLGYVLVYERNLLEGLDQQRRHVWRRYTAGELTGKTLGVLGVGRIGGRIAELGSAVGMRVVGTKRDPSTAPDVLEEVYPPEETHRVLSQSDYVVVACPLTDETEGMLGLNEFSTMKVDAIVINVGRGPIIDEADLITALQKGKIEGAALDVQDPEPMDPDSPLWDLPNVIITPHMAGGTPHYWSRVADIFAENYRAYVADDVDGFVNRVF
jgi:phosphoglycerate dehydrogenase-like enzyme